MNKENFDICKLKKGDKYIKNNEIYQVVVPFKLSKTNSKIFYGLSRYIGVVKNDYNNAEKKD